MAGSHLILAPGLGTTQPLVDVVTRLARRHRVAAHDPGLGPPAAVLTRPTTPWRPEWADAVAAWWVEHPSEVPAAVPPRVRVLVSWPPVAEERADLRQAGVPIVIVPAPGIDGGEWRPMAPFVRARWRRRLGLPDRLVATVGTAGGPLLDDQTAADALLLCSAAVVGPAHALRSLALGTPTVCDVETADMLGAVRSEHVLVATGHDAVAAAEELAADEPRAAVLGRAGRLLVEERHDIAAAARRIAAFLGLPAVGAPPVAGLAGALEALGTPVDARIAAQVAGAVGSLGGTGIEVATRSLRW